MNYSNILATNVNVIYCIISIISRTLIQELIIKKICKALKGRYFIVTEFNDAYGHVEINFVLCCLSVSNQESNVIM